jgi:hypothetical protein
VNQKHGRVRCNEDNGPRKARQGFGKGQSESRRLARVPHCESIWSEEQKSQGEDEAALEEQFERGFVSRLARAAVSKEVFCAYDLAVKCSRNQCFALDLAGFGVRDSDVIHFESAAERSFVVGFSLLEVG